MPALGPRIAASLRRRCALRKIAEATIVHENGFARAPLYSDGRIDGRTATMIEALAWLRESGFIVGEHVRKKAA